MARFSTGLIVGALLMAGCAEWRGLGDDRPDTSGRVDDGTGHFPPDEAGPAPPSLEGPAVTAADPPPPISGGTLLALSDGLRLVASDPDRDRVVVITVGTGVTGTLGLEPGDEPGRAVEDGSGRVHVVLRGGGAIVSFDPRDPATATRTDVCAMPRGIAFEAATGDLHVACRGGELITLPPAGSEPVRTVHVDRDLRDVIATESGLFVSRFRSAQLLRLDDAGTVVTRSAPHDVDGLRDRVMEIAVFRPTVAWRTVRAPVGDFVMVHQRATSGTVQVEPGGYGAFDMCRGGGIVQSAVTVFSADGAPSRGPSLSMVTLPVDVAATDARIAVVSAARNEHFTPSNVFVYDRGTLLAGDGCAFPIDEQVVDGDPIAVAFDVGGRLWVQTREPAAVVDPANGVRFALGGDSVADTGHQIFHMAAGGFLACASCHPEGGDDNHVWTFDGLGPRRTQTMEGGILGSEPFHWSGDMSDLSQLVHEVFTGRMSGPSLRADHVVALGAWLDALPAPAPSLPADADSVERGEALFHDSTVACASCHNGPLLTNNTSVNVGTGEVLQVPRLVGISSRAPYMHTGCAETLADRFGPCGGGDMHGRTSHLSPAQIADLVAYLETL